MTIIGACHQYRHTHELQRQWKHHFNTSPPALATMTAVNQRFNKTGSVEDLARTGRPATVLTEEKIWDIVDPNPRLSTRQGSFQAEVDLMLLCRNCI